MEGFSSQAARGGKFLSLVALGMETGHNFCRRPRWVTGSEIRKPLCRLRNANRGYHSAGVMTAIRIAATRFPDSGPAGPEGLRHQ